MTAQVRLGVVLLCHADLQVAARMARIWADGGARVAIHVDARSDAGGMMQAFQGDDRVVFAPRRRCDWGRFNLVQATQDAAQALFDRWPDCTHVYLASGSCLPLRPISDMTAFLAADPDRDHIESVSAREAGWAKGGLHEERFTLFHPFDWQRRRRLFDRSVRLQRRLGLRRRLPAGVNPHLGSQWWCLTATTLRAILTDPRRAEFDRFFRHVWIPDESYFQTLARRHSARIESRSLTLAQFDHKGRPYLLYDDMASLLAESHCFVARKLWPGASGLLQQFPTRQVALTDPTPPRPDHVDRIIQRRAERRVTGRPGLHMQSRFPRKDAENGKTAGPYAVLQGFSDIFPGFEGWLAPRVAAQVHGHLFDPVQVQFADQAAFGPGAMSDSPALRDHDPQGFLTSLIRHSAQMQLFQFSARDNQALNWYMATDPNARMAVVTGAWLVPLIDSDMPFDDIRRIAAILQRAELDQLKVLQSNWVRARILRWELGDFLARPLDCLNAALHLVDPEAAPVTDLPVMRDLSGLAALLRRLRNSGLRPRLGGDLDISPPPAPSKGKPTDDD
ncbi:beta-1,6-N-acetylglucosaminyltransferase [Paracoccus homiensis]|uniref:Peptide O-xylosyltransferase n=1 Tax=Paracoccus homiensis TaxID=364199 RepID=A0A1H9Z0D1_9RHOB|nr:beta-1,6-N-acetylglucosaminyltransferase [Paracoccus homiensis]SES74427.1 Core-2/I-Branching enzyme [Paracoccus homiensis]